jgi:hypothetical protein
MMDGTVFQFQATLDNDQKTEGVGIFPEGFDLSIWQKILLESALDILLNDLLDIEMTLNDHTTIHITLEKLHPEIKAFAKSGLFLVTIKEPQHDDVKVAFMLCVNFFQKEQSRPHFLIMPIDATSPQSLRVRGQAIFTGDAKKFESLLGHTIKNAILCLFHDLDDYTFDHTDDSDFRQIIIKRQGSAAGHELMEMIGHFQCTVFSGDENSYRLGEFNLSLSCHLVPPNDLHIEH